MKTIIYLIITSLICITLASAARKTSESKKNVILQSTDSKVTSELLTQSAKIISDRLKIYSKVSFDVSILPEKGQILVQYSDNVELSELEGLLTSKGDLSFYETFNRKEIGDLLKNNNHLFDLLEGDPKISSTNSRIGCIASEKLDLVNEYLRSNRLVDNCKFFWGIKSDGSLTCLHALKINKGGRPLLVRSDVETIKSSQDKNSQSFMIEIKFKSASARIWETATKDNLNKPIAIVIDDKVFYDPVVKNTIENGLCEISGNLTLKEVNYFLALVNNEQLPLSFNLQK